MTINPEIADLPRRSPEGGLPPSRNPFAVQALADAFEFMYDADEAKHETDEERATWGPYRGSMAGTRCDRKLYYELTRTEASDPPGLADKYTFWLGKVVHAALQPAILALYPGASEVKHDLRPLGIPGWMRSDLQLVGTIGELVGTETDNPDEQVMVEIKSTNGFSYKMQATNFKGPATGPRYGAVLQALMAAASEGIDKVVVILLSLEKVSPSMALSYSNTEADRFMAEWHYTVSEMRDHLEIEAKRVAEIIAYVDANARADELAHRTPEGVEADGDVTFVLPPRRIRDPEYPAGAIIQRPAKDAAWVVLDTEDNVADNGSTWFCGYCRYFTRCSEDGA